jgi:predicted PurR-regulated permease PerM
VFALFLGANLGGLWGMLLSVPVAASIQVVLFRLFPKLATETPAEMLKDPTPRPKLSPMRLLRRRR